MEKTTEDFLTGSSSEETQNAVNNIASSSFRSTSSSSSLDAGIYDREWLPDNRSKNHTETDNSFTNRISEEKEHRNSVCCVIS